MQRSPSNSRCPTPRRPTWVVFLAGGAGATGGYFLLPSAAAQVVAYSAIGVLSVAAICVGAGRRRGPARRGWLAVALATLLFVLGDGTYDVYQFVLHASVPFPSIADVFYLAGYPLLIIGTVLLTRQVQRPGDARESLTDASIVTFGALALSWHFLLSTYAESPGLGTFGKLVTFAYPVMDIGVVFILVRALLLARARTVPAALFALSVISMIVADFTYDLLSLGGAYATGNPVDAGWLISYVLLAASALHPGHSLLDSPADHGVSPGPTAPPGRLRIPALTLAGFIVPGMLLLGTLTGTRSDVPPLATISAILFALVIIRVRWMMQRLRVETESLSAALIAKASLEDELRHQAFHDGLTGLANRALLHDRVGHALTRSSRTGTTTALCFCDLDGFKTINDTLGHAAGDGVLAVVGERIASAVRAGDTVARLGGDEFAVLLEDVSDATAAHEIASRIVTVLRDPMLLDGHRVSLSASIGLAVADCHATPERLLSQADSAMYEAKAAGRNCVETFEPSMQRRLAERIDVSAALDTALERGELSLAYQPQYALADGSLEGFEALLRWQNPKLGQISPDRFIPIAEETAHIVNIGRWVLEAACQQAMRWQTGGDRPLPISVNLSGRQLRDTNLTDDLRTTLALTGLPAHLLTLEITENVLIADSARNLATIAELKALGIRLSIDDFGTGYSSLSYLQRMPVDELKIDKLFVDALGDAPGHDGGLVKAIIDLAHSLDLRTVAEGIEHPAQQRILRSAGCDSAQGYLLGRPLSADAAAALAHRVALDSPTS